MNELDLSNPSTIDSAQTTIHVGNPTILEGLWQSIVYAVNLIFNNLNTIPTIIGLAMYNLEQELLGVIADAIDSVTAQIRIWEHDIGEFFATTTGQITLGLALPLLTLVGVGVGTLLISTGAWETVVATFEAVKLSIGDFLNNAHLSLFAGINSLLQILSPEYANAWKTLLDAVSGLVDSLGLGVSAFTGIFLATRLVYYDIYSILGAEPGEIETQYWNDVGAFLTQVNDDFDIYARDPNQIFVDFQNTVLFPALQAKNEQDIAIGEAIVEINDTVQEKALQLTNLVTDFNTLIDSFGDEVADAIRENLSVITGPIAEFYSNTIDPILTTLNDAVGIVEDNVERAIRYSGLFVPPTNLHIENFFYLLFDPELSSLDTQTKLNFLLGQITEESFSTQERMQSVLGTIRRRNNQWSVPQPEDDSGVSQGRGFDLLNVPIQLPVGGWFVGEY